MFLIVLNISIVKRFKDIIKILIRVNHIEEDFILL